MNIIAKRLLKMVGVIVGILLVLVVGLIYYVGLMACHEDVSLPLPIRQQSRGSEVPLSVDSVNGVGLCLYRLHHIKASLNDRRSC